MDTMFRFCRALGTMFYLVHPAELEVERYEDAPNFMDTGILLFIFLLSVEFIVSSCIGHKAYFFKDTVMSISLGLIQQLCFMWVKSLAIVPYFIVYKNFRLFDIPVKGLSTFFLAMLGCDFGYYWYHRYAHVWHVLWTGHSVHHSGQHYNLATALRQGLWQPMNSWAIYLPLAVVGVPPGVFACHNQLNTLYQFWIHTELIGHLGVWFEMIFNTPSHHRMHHRPPGNCNYAGVLIIWDRMFGTFVEENRQIRWYGLAKPCNTFNPMLANLNHPLRMLQSMSVVKFITGVRVIHPYVLLTWSQMRSVTCTSDFSRLLWKLPALPGDEATDEKSAYDIGKAHVFEGYTGPCPADNAYLYITFHFLCTFVVGYAMLSAKSTDATLVIPFLFVLASLVCLGKLSEGSTLARECELARIAVVSAVALLSPVGTVVTGTSVDALNISLYSYECKWCVCAAFAITYFCTFIYKERAPK